MVVRDEEEQSRYVLELLDIFDEEGVDAAFAYTFARGDLPTSSDPERDFDLASPGIVKVLEPGQTGTAYPGLPWEPKAAFRSLSEYGRARVARTGQARTQKTRATAAVLSTFPKRRSGQRPHVKVGGAHAPREAVSSLSKSRA